MNRCLLLIVAFFAACLLGTNAKADIDYQSQIKPILSAKCYSCHSALKQKAGLRLETRELMLQGSEQGAIIVPGKPDEGALVQRITTKTDDRMPPPDSGATLNPTEIALIRQWISEGAKAPSEPIPPNPNDHWAFRPMKAPAIPSIRNNQWAKNPIDHFIAQKHEQHQLNPRIEAPPAILLRRLSINLLGLPPTADEIDRLKQSQSVDCYERTIDRLLASPRYGERWGRHWLDVARYADSETDARVLEVPNPWSYTYRDWVISALNEDLPYDQFVIYQIAADRIQHLDSRHLAALGFLSIGRQFARSYPQTVDDRIDAVTRGFLGLTVSCARCHDHKFDPIPTKDYYGLYSILANLRETRDPPLLRSAGKVSPKERRYSRRLTQIRKEEHDYRVRRHGERLEFFKTQTAKYLIAARDASKLSVSQFDQLIRNRQLNRFVLSRWRDYLEDQRSIENSLFGPWLEAAAISDSEFPAKWPQFRNQIQTNRLLKAALSKQPMTSMQELAATYTTILQEKDQAEAYDDKASEQLREVYRGTASPLNIPLNEFKSICSEGDLNNLFNLDLRYREMMAQAANDGTEPRAMAVENVPHPKPAHVFVRGNPNNLGEYTPPHFLTCLALEATEPFTHGTGRLELANAIASPNNPLTARVAANRVWLHHFGSGLVRSPSDFGLRGELPTHPDLLDYLANQLVQSGWSLKHLHRLILSSATYRQSSAHSEAEQLKDPENRLLWRMNRRRLDVESTRDGLLAAAGRLDLIMGGAAFSLTAVPSAPRRTVYAFIQRSQLPSVLSNFDFASPEQHAPTRFTTTVPQQALFFLNSPFLAEQSRYLVSRPEIATQTTSQSKIIELYRAVLGRRPSDRELATGLRFVSEATTTAHTTTPVGPWRYGMGTYDTQTDKVVSFLPFQVFDSGQWQGGAVFPDKTFSTASLRANGGSPGESTKQAVIRRWISPISGEVSIQGTLRHRSKRGDGIKGRIVSSRHGNLASFTVHRSSEKTEISATTVEVGDTIDFVVEAGSDPDNDEFGWAPTIKANSQAWVAREAFAGPGLKPLDIWERYAQALLETNEFAFVE